MSTRSCAGIPSRSHCPGPRSLNPSYPPSSALDFRSATTICFAPMTIALILPIRARRNRLTLQMINVSTRLPRRSNSNLKSSQVIYPSALYQITRVMTKALGKTAFVRTTMPPRSRKVSFCDIFPFFTNSIFGVSCRSARGTGSSRDGIKLRGD